MNTPPVPEPEFLEDRLMFASVACGAIHLNELGERISQILPIPLQGRGFVGHQASGTDLFLLEPTFGH
jgi:hypothetical protein